MISLLPLKPMKKIMREFWPIFLLIAVGALTMQNHLRVKILTSRTWDIRIVDKRFLVLSISTDPFSNYFSS